MITKEDNKQGKSKWLKKLGIAGFLFFLVKGLVWIGVAVFAWLELKK
jgi:hypothetical protein